MKTSILNNTFNQLNMDFSNPSEKNQYTKLVFLVNNIANLQKKYDEIRMDRNKELYRRQTKIVDAHINGPVYDLHGLTVDWAKVIKSGK